MIDRPYGPIVQNAYIVDDLESGIDYWTRVMQVGPFFKFPPIVFVEADYRGRAQAPDFEAAVAYSGDLMIELIRPRGPCIFQEFIEAGRSGVQHVAALADDLHAAAVSIEARGGKRVQGGKLADGSCVAYFEMSGGGMTECGMRGGETRSPDEVILEIACLMPAARGLFEAIKSAAATWDGASPIVLF
jgi:hypothetical protein